MSGFERFLQTALEGVNPRWAREFGDLIRAEEIRAGLNRLQKAGGDPNFALFTLTDCRWRRIKPLPAPRERNRKATACVVAQANILWPRVITYAALAVDIRCRDCICTMHTAEERV
jgi:hypothetical protein